MADISKITPLGSSTTYDIKDAYAVKTVATGDGNGQIKITPRSGSAYNVDVKGLAGQSIEDGTTSYLAYYSDTHTISPTKNAHFRWSDLSGTTKGYEELVLGNKTDRFGRLALYGHSNESGGAYIAANNPTSWLTHTLPDTAGWIVTAGDGSTTGAGGARNPIYVATTGVATAGEVTFDTLNANRLMWTSATDRPYAGYHYANAHQIAINASALPSEQNDYNFYVVGKTYFKHSGASNVRPIISGTRSAEHLSIGNAGFQTYNNDDPSILYLNYYGGAVNIGSADTATATRDFYGTFDFKSANGFTYSGIAAATDNTERPVWFSYNGVVGRPVYDNDFKYNPSTNTLNLAASNNNGTLKTGKGTLTIDAASTIYINNPTSSSIMFTSGGADTSHEMGRFNTKGNFILASYQATVNDITHKLYVTGTSYFNGNTTHQGHIYPQANNTYDLGSSDADAPLYWRYLYGYTFSTPVTTGSHINGLKGIDVAVNMTADAGYNMLARIKSTNGRFNIGVYQKGLVAVYGADTVTTNTYTSAVSLLDEDGNTQLRRLYLSNANNVNGTTHTFSNSSFLEVAGATCIKYNTPNLYLKDTNTAANTYAMMRFGNSSNDNGAYIFLNGPSRANDGGPNAFNIRNNVGPLHLGAGDKNGNVFIYGSFIHRYNAEGTAITCDTNDRPSLSISGQYPQIFLIANANNNSAGATLTFAGMNTANQSTATSGNAGFKAFTFGTPSTGCTWLDLGYGESNYNPHYNGINNRNTGNGYQIMRWNSNGQTLLYANTNNDTYAFMIQARATADTIGTGYQHGIHYLVPNMGTNAHAAGIIFGKSANAGNAGVLEFTYSGTSNGANNCVGLGFWSTNNIIRVYKDQRVTIGNSTSAGGFGLANTSATTGLGISLHNGASTGMPQYGLAFAGTATFGPFGGVTDSWATYFTTSNTAARGWIFKKYTGTDANTKKAGNIAAIRASDGMYFGGGISLRHGPTDSWYGDFYINTAGTANSGTNNEKQGTAGIALLRIGNNVAHPASGTAGGANNAYGILRIYGTGTTCTDIVSQPNGSRTFYLPNYGGAMYAVHAGGNAAVGSATQPVYVAANGRVSTCTAYTGLLTALSWTAGTTAGPTLSLTVGGTTKTAVLPTASASAAGAVTTDAQTWAGAKTLSGGMIAPWIELPSATPYIDFRHGSSTADYTSRIISSASGRLEIMSNNTTANTTYNSRSIHARLYVNGGALYTNGQIETNTYFLCNRASTGGGYYLYGNNVQFGQWYINSFGAAPKATTTNGTTTYSGGSAGQVILAVGNNRVGANNANGVANNAYGRIFVYDTDSSYLEIRGNGYFYNKNLVLQKASGANFTIRNTTSGQWAFLRLHNNAAYWDIATNSTAAGTAPANSLGFRYNSATPTATAGVWITPAQVLMGAAWNDYAECRATKDEIEPGRCVKEIGDDTLEMTTKRLERGCEIVSDTYGFIIGKTEKCQTPIASSGRVLAYGYESREEFASHIGWPVCSGPDGTVSIMTEEEEEKYPSRIIGTVSAVPDYEEWGTGNVKVNGRVWIRIR